MPWTSTKTADALKPGDDAWWNLLDCFLVADTQMALPVPPKAASGLRGISLQIVRARAPSWESLALAAALGFAATQRRRKGEVHDPRIREPQLP